MARLPDNFMSLCRDMYWAGQKPFGFDMWDSPYFNELQAIAKNLTIHNLYEYFPEHQYYIDLYAAIFVLDIFKLSADDKLTGVNSNISVVQECFTIIEKYAKGFNPMQRDDYHHWSKKIKLYYKIS